jgi:hypothetical protein
MAPIPMKNGRLAMCGFTILVLLLAGMPSPAMAQDVEVTAADPDSAEQGTVNLDVAIHGNGFAKGAVAEFLVTGETNPGGIVVNRTTFRGPKKLIANIDVDEDAVVGGFDIQVRSNGRTGKGIDLFAVQAKDSANPPQGPGLGRAVFRDLSSDRVRSDGIVLPWNCEAWHYVDPDDPCYGGAEPLVTVSKVHSDGLYFLRTVSNLDPQTVDRWLVLDFSDSVAGPCPGLDTQIRDDPNTDPDVRGLLPEDPDPCIDLVETRFYVNEAFNPSATQSAVNMLIDKPVRKTGKGKNAEDYTQWDGMFTLEFLNPLTLTRGPSDTVTVGASGDDFQAYLWPFNDKGRKGDLLGIFSMEFRLTITIIP